ncbi:(deoxy)nucleoside triphosphate pyrophosphohydrolase [Antrihabitans sp. YC2-6]|uniref:(deoxy)nucleoside triphosphate pyrophosphohydrolase n=1 Tax=Antrihabitans sp. YC2-6 TaxID=2799498 RepID=UPI0018F44CCD|nr:(deoxy)nucleoside triphosphate pyrophosphohydrolase [Antrihabitans sp. YC2-6]MBJ8343666.1 (deoxy)nucleoside triphosphate pyrophosphohydrolase [Antrihabitans sp. YC2-6]
MQPEPIEVVAAAIVAGGRLLLAQRTRPPEFAGLWELPGGKVEADETPAAAVARELREELGIEAVAGERIGVDVDLPNGFVLRAYRTTVRSGIPQPLDHAAVCWVTAAQLREIDLVPNDRIWLEELVCALTPRAPSSAL